MAGCKFDAAAHNDKSCPGGVCSAGECCPTDAFGLVEYYATGGVKTPYSVALPKCTNWVLVEIAGSDGGSAGDTASLGGAGATVRALVNMTGKAGKSMILYVGQMPTTVIQNGHGHGVGGWPQPGSGGEVQPYGPGPTAGGGGLSKLLAPDTAPLIIAGAGGGASGYVWNGVQTGGNGGYPNGKPGVAGIGAGAVVGGYQAGQGGGQSGLATGGCGNATSTWGNGEYGGMTYSGKATNGTLLGGGGGGQGFVSGGGGAVCNDKAGGGGGGSSWVNTAFVTGATFSDKLSYGGYQGWTGGGWAKFLFFNKKPY